MISIILLILFIPICLLLILIVLLQAGKGGGLAGAFGGVGSQTLLGSRGTADFLGKFTVYLAIGFMALALLLSITYGRERVSIKKEETKAVETGTPAGETPAGTEGTSSTSETKTPAGQTQQPGQTQTPPPAPGANTTPSPPPKTGN